jgi:hydroxymethylpyrimidine/phosphomethylpyrimidine kinase
MTNRVLSIAGSDPSGGAGIQADLKTIAAHQIYGMAIPTLITVQNSMGIVRVELLSAEIVAQQLENILIDIPPQAIKIGALGSGKIIKAILPFLQQYTGRIVLDPILISSSGKRLIDESAVAVLKRELIPLCSIITPNHDEYQILFGDDPPTIPCLRTDGHSGSPTCRDELILPSGCYQFEYPKLERRNTHGTGCTLSSAIACNLSKGLPLKESCENSINYVHQLLKQCDQHSLGNGNGGLGHEFLA